MSDICIGIDLGTTYCCVGVWDNDLGSVRIFEDENGKTTTPSYVAFKLNENEITERLIGYPAKKYKMPIYNTKRLMGKHLSEIDISEFKYDIVPDQYDNPLIKISNELKFKPEEIGAMLLSKMKSIAEAKLGVEIKNAVITTPAYFNDAQRNATKTAAQIAGLNCVRIINEPTAACLCYGLGTNSNGTNSNVLVFDLGGGTFDVSILNINDGTFEVLAVNGDTHLGGEDFDDLLINYICEKLKIEVDELSEKDYKKLKLLVENAKCELSSSYETEIDYNDDDTFNITRAEFENICEDLFTVCFSCVTKVLTDAKLDKNEIDEIILVGGSTRIPKIQSMLSDYFNGKKLNKSVHPDHAVAYGASIQGTILLKNDTTGKTNELLLIDVIPLSIGIKTSGGIMTKIIPRNTQVPYKKTSVFTTTEDFQTEVEIEMYEGEREFTVDNHLLDKFTFKLSQKAIKGIPKISIDFDIDENGILNITASNNNNKSTFTIDKESKKLLPEEIDLMLSNAQKFQMKDQIKKNFLVEKNNIVNYLQQQQNIINSCAEGSLNLEDISFSNQLIISTLEWLDQLSPEEQVAQKIIQCKEAVQFRINPIINKIYSSAPSIPNIDETVNKISNEKLEQITIKLIENMH